MVVKLNRQETGTVLSILRIAYPHFYKDITKEDAYATIDLWVTMFENETAQLVTEAVKALITTHKFPPTISEVKAKIRLITAAPSDNLTESEAWNEVRKSISYYDAAQNFERLSPILQKLVGSANQLREWSQMESDTLNTVVQSNFMRSYRVKSEREKEYKALPESTKLMISEISGKLNMIGDGT